MSGLIEATLHGVPDDAADFVVVGSGAGGGAAARALAASGRSVIVLEEGPPVERVAHTTVVRKTMHNLFRQQGRFAAFGRAPVPMLQGRCVGGTTFVNSAICWRLPEKVLARWHRDFGLEDGLPAAALEAAFARIEAEMTVHPVDDAVAGRNNGLLKVGAAKVGIEARAIHRNEQGCQGSARCLHGCPHQAKQSTSINYLRRAMDDGATIVSDARVERVVIEGDRAVAVTGTIVGDGARAGQAFRVRARRAVVLAASAIQSPNLLRRSNIARGSGHLGEHFMAHPGTAVTGIYPERVNAWGGASQGYEAFGLRDTLGVKFEAINVPPEVSASRLPGAGRRLAQFIDKLDRMAIWAAALRADAEGRIRPSWIFGDQVSYSLLPSDMERLRTALRHLAEMHFAAGAVEVLPAVFGLPEVLRSPDELRVFDEAPLDPRAYSVVATHLFGGCRAGRDPASSVVDPSLRVHGVEGLYVMDASVFPTNIGVNPQHSIMGVATVAAERLAAA